MNTVLTNPTAKNRTRTGIIGAETSTLKPLSVRLAVYLKEVLCGESIFLMQNFIIIIFLIVPPFDKNKINFVKKFNGLKYFFLLMILFLLKKSIIIIIINSYKISTKTTKHEFFNSKFNFSLFDYVLVSNLL